MHDLTLVIIIEFSKNEVSHKVFKVVRYTRIT